MKRYDSFFGRVIVIEYAIYVYIDETMSNLYDPEVTVRLSMPSLQQEQQKREDVIGSFSKSEL
jgi:hypothetical protein